MRKVPSTTEILGQILRLEESRPLVALVFLVFVAGIVTPKFFSVNNFTAIMSSMAVVATAALGEALIMIMGSIDLSVGSQIGLGALLSAALLARYNFSVEMTIFTVLLVGTMVGFVNGILVTKGRMPSFIITLATLSIIRGAIYLYSDLNIPIFNPTFLSLGGNVGIFPKIFLILLLSTVAFYFFSKFFKIGLYMRAIGGNEIASRNMGVEANGVKNFVFTLCGLLCAMAGIMLASRLGASYPNAAYGYELDVIAAVVVGGVPLTGGKGSLIGALAGAALLATIVNCMVLLNIAAFWQYVVKGTVLVIAATVYRGALPFGR
jgi:ribose transport system permease protein